MSLVPFTRCSGHRAGLFWRSGSVRTPGLAGKWAQAPNSSRALCLVGRAQEAPGGSGGGLELGASPVGGGDESGGGNTEKVFGAGKKGVVVVESGSLWL